MHDFDTQEKTRRMLGRDNLLRALTYALPGVRPRAHRPVHAPPHQRAVAA